MNWWTGMLCFKCKTQGLPGQSVPLWLWWLSGFFGVLFFDRFTLVYGFDGPSAHIAIPPVWSFVIVVVKPFIQIPLELLDWSIEFIAKGFPEKLIQDSPVEPFHESVGTRRSHLGPSVFDLGEIQEDLVGMDHGPATILPAIVGEDMLHDEVLVSIEGQYPIIEEIYGSLRDLGGVKLKKGVRSPLDLCHKSIRVKRKTDSQMNLGLVSGSVPSNLLTFHQICFKSPSK